MGGRPLWAGVLLLAAASAVALVLLREDAPQPGPVPVVSVDMAAQAIDMTQAQDGRVAWRLQAEAAEYDQAAAIVRARQPLVTFYPQRPLEPGATALDVRAPAGVLNQADSSARLDPGVVAEYGSIRMTAKTLDYDGRNLLTARGEVRITRGPAALSAPLAAYDLAAGVFVAQDGVVVTINTPNP